MICDYTQGIDAIRADYYSLGVVLYVMLFGKLPYGAGQEDNPAMMQMCIMGRDGDIPFPQWFETACSGSVGSGGAVEAAKTLKAVLESLLSKDPAGRSLKGLLD